MCPIQRTECVQKQFSISSMILHHVCIPLPRGFYSKKCHANVKIGCPMGQYLRVVLRSITNLNCAEKNTTESCSGCHQVTHQVEMLKLS